MFWFEDQNDFLESEERLWVFRKRLWRFSLFPKSWEVCNWAFSVSFKRSKLEHWVEKSWIWISSWNAETCHNRQVNISTMRRTCSGFQWIIRYIRTSMNHQIYNCLHFCHNLELILSKLPKINRIHFFKVVWYFRLFLYVMCCLNLLTIVFRTYQILQIFSRTKSRNWSTYSQYKHWKSY